MRHSLIAAAALIALTAQAEAAARIPAPQASVVVTSAVQLASGMGNGLRPALPADARVAQIAPTRGE